MHDATRASKHDGMLVCWYALRKNAQCKLVACELYAYTYTGTVCARLGLTMVSLLPILAVCQEFVVQNRGAPSHFRL